ncbi:MAG: adenylate/guanylate cyclase domain-containing protein [Treponema sp.]|nr:adenylate/guanylate cyclase domain-containing protein [Treponema sp.]
MKSTVKKLISFIKPDFWITLLVILIIGILSSLGVFEKLEHNVYDMLMHIKPETPQNKDIMTVNVDDASLERIGVWPWSRDILADAIIRMREFGAKIAVFDIEYIEEAPLGIDPKIVQKMPETFAEGKENIAGMIKELSSAIVDGSLPLEYANEVADDLISSYLSPEFDKIYENTAEKVLRDNDMYFSNAIRYFGNTWLTINSTKVTEKVPDDLIALVKERFLLNNVKDVHNRIPLDNAHYNIKHNAEGGATPALKKLMDNAKGAGFTNVVIDSDGSRRRIELLREYDGQYIGQLIFAPMLDMFDAGEIIRTKNRLIVKDALFPGETKRRDIRIPLDEHGRMLINWVSTSYIDSFKYESVFFLKDIDEIEEHLIEKLTLIGSFRLGNSEGEMLSYYDAVQYLLAEYDILAQNKDALLKGEADNFDDYFEKRKIFFSECSELTDSAYIDEILSLLSSIKNIGNAQEIIEIKEAVKQKFDDFASDLALYNTRFSEMKSRYENAVCVIGNTASASTDLGIMPFEERYPNVGTHANVYNMIIQNQFIVPLPWYVGFAIASVLALLMTAFMRNKRYRLQNIFGISGIFLFPVLSILLMVLPRIYMPLIIPTLIMTLIYIITTILRFVMAERDKRFLRSTLSTYVSKTVVDEIVKDPSKLRLGGDTMDCTAIFTDIRGFSTIAERVDAEYLVNFLNEYLTLLSDVILEKDGTIDKYEGDAIIGFWGAPIAQKDHAWRACLSAVRMKQAEKAFNDKMVENGTIITGNVPPINENGDNKVLNKIVMPISTRIGLNSGEMVVGNMGTENKKNYTMMGTNVNLAARLEGVNKIYNSWILASEFTWNLANSGENEGKLVARRLDKVRVVGIKQPVQLYNIVGLKSEMSNEELESVKIFHQGMDRYLQRDFVNAKKLFNLSHNTFSDDGPALVFADRCDELIKKGVGEDWTGVVNMTSK